MKSKDREECSFFIQHIDSDTWLFWLFVSESLCMSRLEAWCCSVCSPVDAPEALAKQSGAALFPSHSFD